MINLLYCGNLKMFDGVMLSLISAAKKSSTPFNAYILTMDLRQEDSSFAPFEQAHIDIIDKAVKLYNKECSVVLVDGTTEFLARLGESENLKTSYTPYCLLRLFADILDLPERILYLDTDTMFFGDLAEISDIGEFGLDGFELAAAPDHLGKHFIARDYINTGVLYLNLPVIRETGLFRRALELCLTRQMVFPDQDALNELLTRKLVLPRRFNEQRKLKNCTVIQHFSKSIRFFPLFRVLNVKQWQINSVRKTLGIRAYDSVFADFIELRERLGAGVLEPFESDTPPSLLSQIKNGFRELKTYRAQNGGIFRKNKNQ